MPKPPVILGNAPSSGSTLLVNVLGRIAGLHQGDELNLFDKPDWLTSSPERYRASVQGWLARGYRRRLACETRPALENIRQHGTDKDAALEIARHSSDYLDFCLRLMDDIRRRNGCDRWVEKTPANIFALSLLADRLPDAQFICITRSPVSSTLSLLRRGFSPNLAVARWYLSNLAVHALRGRANVRIVSYEQLTSHPAGVIEEVCGFIGEPFHEGLLNNASSKSKAPGSWTRRPDEPITRSELKPADIEQFSTRIAPVLSTMRATADFHASIGAAAPLTPMQLCEELGYEVPPPAGTGTSSGAAKDALRYRLSMLRYGMLPKTIPFTVA